LIKQNKEALLVSREEDILSVDELSKSEIRAKERYTKNLAEENLKAICDYSSKLLDVLCSIFLTSSKDAIGLLQVCYCCVLFGMLSSDFICSLKELCYPMKY